jgi:hypothetical protein
MCSPRSSRTLSSVILLCLLLGAIGCSRPWLLLPGGALDGESAPVPDDWAFSDAVSTIQIETRPEDPYSVNIWVVSLDDALYLHAGANRATWIEHLEADPRLRARIDGRLFDLRATRVVSPEEFARFADAYDTKYGVRPRNENVAEVYLMRLEGR